MSLRRPRGIPAGQAMDDRELERLIRMAVEAEELEGSADGPLAFGRAPRGGLGRWTGTIVTATAAAGLLLAFTLFVRFNTPAPITPGPIADGTPATSDPVHAAEPRPANIANAQPTAPAGSADEGCVVMAFYQGPDGECSCLSIRQHEWDGGRRLADVARAELMDAALQEQCSTDAQQVYVVAVAGKPETLPRTRDEAEAIGTRLADAPRTRTTDISSYAYSAIPQLGADSTVIAERLAIRPASHVRDTLAALAGQYR